MSRPLWLFLPVLLLALPASAESLAPRDPLPAATVQIDPAQLTPDVTRLEEGRTLRIANHSSGLARLEFDLRRGTGLPCGRPGEAPVEARKFVLADGESLLCTPPPGRVGFRVQRVVRAAGGGLRNQISEGEIEVR